MCGCHLCFVGEGEGAGGLEVHEEGGMHRCCRTAQHSMSSLPGAHAHKHARTLPAVAVNAHVCRPGIGVHTCDGQRGAALCEVLYGLFF